MWRNGNKTYLNSGGLLGSTLKLESGGNMRMNSFLSGTLWGCLLWPAGRGTPNLGLHLSFSSSGYLKYVFESCIALLKNSWGTPWLTMRKKPYSEQALLIVSLAFFLPFSSFYPLKKGERSTVGKTLLAILASSCYKVLVWDWRVMVSVEKDLRRSRYRWRQKGGINWLQLLGRKERGSNKGMLIIWWWWFWGKVVVKEEIDADDSRITEARKQIYLRIVPINLRM